MKNIRIFYLKIFIFLVVKFSVYLNRYVFVMLLCRYVRGFILGINFSMLHQVTMHDHVILTYFFLGNLAVFI